MKNAIRFICLLSLPFLVAASVVVSAPAFAPAGVTLPHTFAADTPARASEVNQNFEALENAINLNGLAIDDIRSPENTIVVAESGGDFESVADALDSITDSSSTNPYVVIVQPGVYIETRLLEVKSFVALAGFGPEVTTIRRDVASDFTNVESAAVVLLDNAIVRDLSVLNSGSSAGSQSIGVLVEGIRPDIVLKNVSVRVNAVGTSSIAVRLAKAEMRIENCKLFAEGGSISTMALSSNGQFGLLVQPRTVLINCKLEAEGTSQFAEGIGNVLSDLDLRDSHVKGETRGARVSNGGVISLSNCTIESAGPVLVVDVSGTIFSHSTRFSGLNATGTSSNFKYVHCSKADFSPVVNGSGSSIE